MRNLILMINNCLDFLINLEKNIKNGTIMIYVYFNIQQHQGDIKR